MASTFLYDAPVVELGLEPGAGPPGGGTAVVITGRGYLPGAGVTFGGVAAPVVTYLSGERLEVTTPAHAVGAVDVVVTNPDASAGTLAGGYVYETDAPIVAVSYRTPAGAPVSTKIRQDPTAPQISQSLGQPSTMTFAAGIEPGGLQRIEYRSFGRTLFLGLVTGKTARVDGAARLEAWDVQCTDLAYLIARSPHPIGTWVDTSATTVLVALIGEAGGFSAAGVEGGLPNVTVSLDGTPDRWAAIVDVCNRAGAKVFLDGSTVYAFTEDSGFDPPDDVTESNPDLLWTEPGQAVTIEWDYSQIRNCILIRGAEGATTRLEHGGSIALYGRSWFTINDNTLTTDAERFARAQAELDAWAFPIPIVHYATRDMKTRAGKTVTVEITRPAISGAFVIQTVTIDQLELAVATPATRPRFIVTAKPADARMGNPGDVVGLLQSVIDLKANADKQPRMDGDVVSTPGGRTTIPDGSVPATKLAGCIPSSKLDPTGVAPDTYGDGAHLTTFTVDAAGRITGATVDPVAVVKVDGSQPFTADQPMGGHTVTGLAAPVASSDAATKAYVDAAVPTLPSGLIRADGSVPFAADESLGGFKLTNLGTPTTGTDAATKAYVDAAAPTGVVKADGSVPFTAAESMGGFKLTNLATPTASTDAVTKAYVDAAVSSGAVPAVKGEVPAGLVNGSNALFTTASAYGVSLAVYLNGVRQKKTLDYTETSATTFTFVAAPLTGDVVLVDYGEGGPGAAPSHNLLSGTHPDTTPASPVKGDLIVSNGSTWLKKAVGADGSALLADSAQSDGLAWSSLAVVAANVYRATAQTLTALTDTAIALSTAAYDTATIWSAGAPTRLTVPAGHAGKYLVLGQVAFVTFAGTGRVVLSLRKNGGAVAHTVHNVASSVPMMQVCGHVDCAAGDYLELYAYVDESGGGPHDTVGGVDATYFAIAKVAATAATPAAAGALVLLESHTAAASASLDFVTRNAAGQSGATFAADFDEYVIELVNVRCATNDTELRQLYSVNGGSTWDASAIYDATYHYISTTGATSVGQATAQTFASIGGNLSNATTGGVCGSMRLYSPRDTVVHKASFGLINFLHSGVGRINFTRSYLYKNAAAINATRFVMAAGNIASGTIRIYGVAP